MAVSEISSNSNRYQINNQKTNSGQVQKNFQLLGQALQSGNLSGAQQIFETLKQLLPNLSVTNLAQTGQQGNIQNTFAGNFNAIGQALKTGDLSKARSAFTKLQQDMQSAQRGNITSKTIASQNSASASNNYSNLATVSRNNYVGNNINVTT